jgi:hypothetical protein
MKLEINPYTFIGIVGIAYILMNDGVCLPGTTGQITQVVYVYEKDSNPVPRPVAGALMAINADKESGIEATEFEEDTVDGDGDVPEQYEAALKGARESGLPALVVLDADGRIIRVVSSPTTEEQVMEAID